MLAATTYQARKHAIDRKTADRPRFNVRQPGDDNIGGRIVAAAHIISCGIGRRRRLAGVEDARSRQCWPQRAASCAQGVAKNKGAVRHRVRRIKRSSLADGQTRCSCDRGAAINGWMARQHGDGAHLWTVRAVISGMDAAAAVADGALGWPLSPCASLACRAAYSCARMGGAGTNEHALAARFKRRLRLRKE